MKVFLSYSHTDREIATKLYNYLVSNNFDVFWDQNKIGYKLESIQETMLECDILIVIVSEISNRSRFVQSEIMMALGYSKVRTKPIIFPYIVYGTEVPIDLMGIQCFKGTDQIDNDLEKILQALNAIKGTIIAEKEENNEKAEVIHTSLANYISDVFKKTGKKREKEPNSCLYFLRNGIFVLSFVNCFFFIKSIYCCKGL